MSPALPLARAALVIGLVALAVAGCGRRGPLEPPPRPGEEAAAAAQQQPTFGAPVGTSRNRAREPIAVPNRPFILDPLL